MYRARARVSWSARVPAIGQRRRNRARRCIIAINNYHREPSGKCKYRERRGSEIYSAPPSARFSKARRAKRKREGKRGKRAASSTTTRVEMELRARNYRKRAAELPPPSPACLSVPFSSRFFFFPFLSRTRSFSRTCVPAKRFIDLPGGCAPCARALTEKPGPVIFNSFNSAPRHCLNAMVSDRERSRI